MMKTKIYNLIVLDASGSMSAIHKQAVDGVNETVQTIREAQKKHEEQLHYVTLVSFNSSETKKIYDGASAFEVEELRFSDFRPTSRTPLYDAMGFSLTELRSKVSKDDKVLVTVITDGEENDSKEYTGKAIADLVDRLKADNWIFTYIGANQDVAKVAASINICNSICFEATEEGTSNMFAREGKARARFFDRISSMGKSMDSDSMNKDYFE